MYVRSYVGKWFLEEERVGPPNDRPVLLKPSMYVRTYAEADMACEKEILFYEGMSRAGLHAPIRLDGGDRGSSF